MDKQKELFISPINKIKRILLHFAELLLVFMVGFTIVNAVVFPIANKFFKVEDRISAVDDLLDKKMDILYDHQLLFYEKENDKYDISKSLNYTFDLYLESYVLAKPDQNVIDNYFSSTLKDEELYFEIYSAADKDYQFFCITNVVTLKQEFIDLFSPYFSTTNSLSIVGKEKLEIFKNKIFTNIYNFILNNIESHNLISEISGTVYSYNDIIYSIERINTEINYYFSIGTIIGFIITAYFDFLSELNIVYAFYNGYTVSYGEHCAGLHRVGIKREILNAFAKQRNNLAGIVLIRHRMQGFLQLPGSSGCAPVINPVAHVNGKAFNKRRILQHGALQLIGMVFFFQKCAY